jgi:hypothetical protein
MRRRFVTRLAVAYGEAMRNREAIADDLERIIAAHYYGEDFELLSAVRAYRDSLPPPERDELGVVVLQRLLREDSIVEVLLCAVVEVPAAAPLLAAKLDRESAPSQTTRALLTALQQYRGDEVFAAVERFVDSDQEHEALQALARVDFRRSAPYLLRALRRDAQRDLCLHILHDRLKAVGREALAEDLRALAAHAGEDLGERVARALRAKPPPFNPMAEADIVFLLTVLA